MTVWWAKLEKNDKVRDNMTQIASLLVVATVFTWIMVIKLNVYILQSGRGGLIRETKLSMQELELKSAGGRNCGILR